MDVLLLSRLQFAVTCAFHFLFVPLTLGLSVLTAWMEWRYVKTGDETWRRMTKFWGKLFLINFAIGVVTGISLEFQFGMNWAEYSKYVGDIFGAPLAIEATVAFATNLSALWILLANGWMQNPIGAKLTKIVGNPLITERAEMSSFLAVVTNPYGWLKFIHTVLSGYTVAAFFVMGIAAWHLLRKNETDLFKRSFRAASVFGLSAVLLVLATGDFHAVEIAKTQPTKLAALEAIWDTQPGGTSLSLISIPLISQERNIEFGRIPHAGSILAFHNPTTPIRGLKEFTPEDRPPVGLTYWSFRSMVIIGTAMLLLSLIAVYLSLKNRIDSSPLLLKIFLWTIPLPYLACQLGWIVAEVGRQPWLVYGMLRTADGVSKSIAMVQVVGSLAAFTLIYGLLGVIGFYLIVKYARKGPDAAVPGLTTPHRKEA